MTVGEVLRQQLEEVLDAWRRDASLAAAARGLAQPELLDIMPKYLDALATADDPGDFNRSRRRFVESHLSSRIRQGFDLPEILAEFKLLGRVIADACREMPAGDRPDALDLQRYNDEITDASQLASEMFHEYLVADEQRDKLYDRLIQTIATEALQENAPRLGTRLKEIVALLMEALGAQSASLLLLDPVTKTLITAASAGLAAEELEKYTCSLDNASFVTRVMTNPEPTEVYDAQVAGFDVSDALTSAGVRSVIGVRLPQRHRLVGVLYFGLTDAREFMPHEVLRVQAMADRLTLHLDNARLFAALHSQIDALHLERLMRERFVSVLAHDLRGPLSVVQMGAQLLVDRPESLEERREVAQRISRNVDRADRMIRDLLDANRIRAGERLPLKLGELDLGALAREVVEEAATLHGDRLRVVTEDGVIGTWSADELRRALWNLVTNAAKYGAPDTPITVRVHRTAAGAQASVHNLGPAIPVEDQEHLFDAYSRTRAAQAGTAKGWGLGLTLVRGAAEAHGGTVGVTSDEQGTTFTIDLPLDARPFQPLASATHPTVQ